MECYEQPRMTNEETDKCAAHFRQFMTNKQEDLHKSLMNKCVGLNRLSLSLTLYRKPWRFAQTPVRVRQI